jgi:hypothetical protein
MKKSKVSLAVGFSIALSSLLPVSIANADNVYRMSFGATNSGIQIVNDPLFFKDVSLSKQEEYDSEWLTFLRQETGQDISSIDDLNYSNLTLSLGYKSLENIALPSGPLNIQTPAALIFQYNNLTHLNFLRTTTAFRSSAYFNNNALKNVNGLLNVEEALFDLYLLNNELQQVLGLEKLTSVSRNLDLSNNPELSTLDGMEKLEYIGHSLNLSKNPALVDLTGISALSSVGSFVYVDNVAQYTATPKAESAFCKSLVSGDINIKDMENNIINFGQLCSDVEPWVKFMHSYDQLTNLANMSEWKTKAENVTLSNKNLADADLPSGPMLTDTIKGLSLGINDISHVDFLSNVVYASGSLNLNYLPNLNNVDGLSSLQSVYALALNNNPLLSNVDGLSALLRSTSNLSLNDNLLLSDVDGLSSLREVKNLRLNDNPLLSNVDGLSALEKVSYMYINNNPLLSNVDGLSALQSVYYLGLNDNDALENINGLSSLSTVQNNLDLRQNPQLSDISGIASLSATRSGNYAYFDNPSQYTVKPTNSSPFCQGLLSGAVSARDNLNKDIYYGSICQGSEDWIAFMHDYDQLTNLSTMSEWETKTGNAFLNNKSITDEKLPSGPMLSDNIRYLNFSSNDISHIDFLSNVVTATSTLNLNYLPNLDNVDGLSALQSANNVSIHHNPLLSSVDGLSSLQSLSYLSLNNNALLSNVDGLSSLNSLYNLYLNDNESLENINGLSALSTVSNSLDFRQNPQLIDISGIANVSAITNTRDNSYAYFDNPSQYTVKPINSSLFCQGLLSGDIRAKDNLNKDINYGSICEGAEDWIAFMHGYDQLTNLGTMSQWETKSGNAYLQSKNLTDADLPSGPMLSNKIRYLNLANNNISDVDFLSNIVTSTSTLNLDRLANLEDVDGLSSLQSAQGLYLRYAPLLSNINGLSSLQSATHLYLNDNPLLLNVDGLSSLQSVDYLSLYDNESLENINGLSALSAVDRVVDLRRNPQLSDISGIANVSSISDTRSTDNIYFDHPSQYTTKPVTSSPFCQGLLSGDVRAVYGTSSKIGYGSICEGAEEWIAFMHDNDQLTNLSTMSQWKTKTGNASLQNKSLTDADMPSSPILSDTIRYLDLSNNDISHVDFLSNVVTATSTLSLYRSDNLENVNGLSSLQSAQGLYLNAAPLLTNVDGLSSLQTVGTLRIHSDPSLTNVDGLSALNFAYALDLSNNNALENINGLSALSTAEVNLDFTQNPNLTDISGIANLSAINTKLSFSYAYFDNPSQYTVKPVSSSPFCQGLVSGDIRAKQGNNTNIYYGSICEGVESWIAFMHEYSQLTNLGTMSEWTTKTGNASINNKNLTDADMPLGPILNNTIRGLDISSNNISNIDFLSNVVTATATLKSSSLPNLGNVDGLSALQTASNLFLDNNSSMTNINGLSALQSAEALNLSRNPLLSNVDGLSSLTYVRNLYLHDNEALENVNGLSGLSSLGYSLDFRQNPKLTDISGIANIASITRTASNAFAYFDNPSQYTVKPASSSPFCQGLLSGDVGARNNSNQAIYYGSICEGVEPWIALFHSYNQITDLGTMSDWKTKGGNVSVHGRGLTDADLPLEPIQSDTIQYLNLGRNNISHLDFLSNVVTSTSNLTFNYLPNLDNVDGLSALQLVDNLYLDNNPLLSNVDGLSSLVTVKWNLKLHNNPKLTDISGLSNLSSLVGVNSSYALFIDEPSQYTSRPAIGTPFCEALRSEDISVRQSDGTPVYYSKLCY